MPTPPPCELPTFDLSGRIALVTGASSGLGARFATILAAAGARVVVGARRVDRLDALVAAIRQRGGTAVAVSLDVTDETSVQAAYDTAEQRFGPVDTVIANAGISVSGPSTDLNLDAFDSIVAVNLRGVFVTVREGARRMIAAGSADTGRGRVVILSSITADAVSPGLAAYSATKAGVQQMGRVMARDWARSGINVNMLCPGYIRTDINADWFDTPAGARHVETFPRRRLLAEDALDVPLLYLASDASAGVTGSCFTIDDGQSL